ncbi:MAG TPA: hypothetical protein VEU07_05960 [Candidatus Acidoferrum sp.]|nr:hypothetical protein [Candidatus Acidoferrum sp.]
MDPRAIFALSALLTLVSSAVGATLYVWPWLQGRESRQALESLVAPHMFCRFIGLSFLVPGVVSPALPAAFAIPAAYGDCVAGIFAIVAILALAKHVSWAIPAVWVFNVWGAADLLFAFYAAPHAQMHPEMLGAAFYLPTAIVPPLLVTHFLIFRLLLHPRRDR